MKEFFESGEIVLVNSAEIIGIVRSALSKIDPRLIEHGERVGYIASKIRSESERISETNPSVLLVLSVLHDIGAYKTNEIDDMIRFESDTVFEHSLYGYLFLKSTSVLSEYAEAVLHHHTPFTSPELQKSPCADYAELISLADRADIIYGSGRSISIVKKYSGTKFAPCYVEALLRAEEKYCISELVASGGYKNEFAELSSEIHIKNSEIMDYLKLLVYAIDFRSPFTVTHTADTTLISLEMGKLLGIGEHELQALYIGSFLHDIGKIAVPHSLIEKPGRLTPEEFELVKKHIPEGGNILRGVVSDEICDIALRHHEKLDGSGYSLGLRAEALTLPQRIVAVSDILSALSQRRSYKEPFPKDKVIAILRDSSESGKLCPVVTGAVIDNYDLILKKTENSHDPVKSLYKDLMKEYSERIEAEKINLRSGKD